MLMLSSSFFFFFFNDTATTEIYTLSLHDALPIFFMNPRRFDSSAKGMCFLPREFQSPHENQGAEMFRNVEIGRAHVELQSRLHLVCRLLLEKKKKKDNNRCICRIHFLLNN